MFAGGLTAYEVGTAGYGARAQDASTVLTNPVQEATTLGIFFLPSIAYKVNDKLSLGASLGLIKLELAALVDLRRFSLVPV